MNAAGKSDRTKHLNWKTVKGNPYLYFRMKDGKLVSLPLDQDSGEFKRSYDLCLKARNGVKAAPVAVAAPPALKHVGFIGGTVGKAIETYMRSPEWAELRESSKRGYRAAFDVMRDKIGITLLCEYDLDAINLYSAELAIKQKVERVIRGKLKEVLQGGPSTADFHVFLLSNVWQVCRKFPEFGIKNIPNPCADADRRYAKAKNPSKPWREEQQERFMATAPDYLQLGKLMLLFLGQRGGDCVKIKWIDFDGKGIFVAPEKGDDPEPDFLKCPKPLLDAIKRAQKRRGNAPTILVNHWGKAWTDGQSLSAAIRNHLIKIGLAERGTRTISMHGLRKNAAINAAETMLGTAGIKSTTLHKSSAMAEYYAKKAEQRRMNEKVVDAIDEAYAEKVAVKLSGRRANIRRVK
jgi:integrase